jgi:hypothetical protein
MRIRMIGILGAGALAVTACGSVGGQAPTQNRPPTPVNLTVYVNDSRVSVSPASVGAGPVVFIVTNQAGHAVALTISGAGQGRPLASTAPINPQGTTQVSVDFRPGDYTIATSPQGSTDASLSAPSAIRSASIHIGPKRAGSNSALLQP